MMIWKFIGGVLKLYYKHTSVCIIYFKNFTKRFSIGRKGVGSCDFSSCFNYINILFQLFLKWSKSIFKHGPNGTPILCGSNFNFNRRNANANEMWMHMKWNANAKWECVGGAQMSTQNPISTAIAGLSGHVWGSLCWNLINKIKYPAGHATRVTQYITPTTNFFGLYIICKDNNNSDWNKEFWSLCYQSFLKFRILTYLIWITLYYSLLVPL